MPEKTAKPNVPADLHQVMKREAKKRGRHLPQFYGEIIKRGLDSLKADEAKQK